MKKKVIGSLALAFACTLVAGIAQLNTVSADAAVSFVGHDDLITVDDVVYIRVNDENASGIRFAATIDKTEYDKLETENGANKVSAGMIIVPSDYVTNAGAFTHEAISAKYNTYTYQETNSFKLSDDETSYQFAVSLMSLKESNYARDFCATAYVKVEKESGTEYLYASFNQEENARNVYEIAQAGYNNRKDEADEVYKTEINGSFSPLSTSYLTAMKGYMDKVAVVNNVDGIVTNNDTQYYTSPFQVIGADGNYALDGNGTMPTTLLYNGQAVKNTTITDGDTQIAMVQSHNTTYADGVAKVENGCPPNTNIAMAHYDTTYNGENGYVAFNGNYGVGTFIDVTFKGNNMPYVTFFADNINGNVSKLGGTGLMICNGMVAESSAAVYTRTDVFRIYEGRHDRNFDGEVAATGKYAKMTQDALAATPNTIYTLTAGTILSNGKVNLYLALKDNAGVEVARVLAATNLTTGSGNIILFGCMKGLKTLTEFSYSAPYEMKVDANDIVKSQGAIWNSDGSVSLKGVEAANANVSNMKLVSNSYIAFDAQYGAGTTVEVDFVGNNMPYIMFFADDTDYGNMTSSDGGKGALFINGMKTQDSDATYHTRYDSWKCFIPNRIDYNLGGSQAPAGAENLTQAYLMEHPDTHFNFKLKLKLNGGQNFVLYEAILTDTDKNEVVASVGTTSEATVASYTNLRNWLGLASDAIPTGKIVLYASMKGADEWTTFKYKVPYTN